MKKEVELKFNVDRLAAVRKKLQALGAREDWAGKEKNWYLDTPAHTLEKRHAALRIRDAGGSKLTYKEKLGDKKFKAADEYQLDIGDAKELLRIFQRLGFVIRVAYTKYREYWHFEGADITLDRFPFGSFVEIEAPRRKIEPLARKLGLDIAKSTTKTYIRLLEEHSKKQKPR